MLRRPFLLRMSDKRCRLHMMIDEEINPREWFNFQPKEFLPNYYYDRHKFLFEQTQWSHMHHLLCHQVYLKDMMQLLEHPEPTTVIIDCRTEPTKMHRWIPNSNWLPRDEIDYALQLMPDEFLAMYGFPKPALADDVILVSHCGHASEQTGWEFRKAYFHHVYNYRAGTNELFGEEYQDYPLEKMLKPWKGPFPQNGYYFDHWSKRKVLTRTGPFDRRYEMQDFSLPDLEAERVAYEDRSLNKMPWGLR